MISRDLLGEDHEIFRLKDEVQASEGSNVTFYSFMGLKESANQKVAESLGKDLQFSRFIGNAMDGAW